MVKERGVGGGEGAVVVDVVVGLRRDAAGEGGEDVEQVAQADGAVGVDVGVVETVDAGGVDLGLVAGLVGRPQAEAQGPVVRHAQVRAARGRVAV